MSEITISDLNPELKKDESRLRPLDLDTLPKKVEEKGEPDPVQKTYDKLDKYVEEINNKAVEAIKENNERILTDQCISENDNIHEDTVLSSKSYDSVSVSLTTVKDEDDVSSEEEKEAEKKLSDEELADIRMDKLKRLLKDKIKPVKKQIDLSTFTLNTKPNKIFQLFDMQSEQSFVSDWLLPGSNKIVSMEEFKGSEINSLNPQNSSRTPLNTTRDVLYLIWDHIKNTNKPAFENWLKITKYSDLQHLYFAVYKASFDGINTVPYYCTSEKCDEVFLHDVNIMDMVKFNDKKDKEIFSKALIESRDSHYSEDELGIDMELVQISDDFAFALKDATLFSVQIEPLYLSQKFREENADNIGILMYVEDIYYINRETQSLDPVGYKEYPDSIAKTVGAKFKKYIDIVKALDSDQLYTLQALIAKINEKNMDVSYVIPGQICPKCGTKIEEEDRDASEILFTRHQLAALANM